MYLQICQEQTAHSGVASCGASIYDSNYRLFHGDKSILRHAGKHKTYGAMRNRFVWKGMTQAVRQWVSACYKCLLRKRQVPLQTKDNIQPEAEAPMKRICIDIVGPLVKTRNGNTHIFTIYGEDA